MGSELKYQASLVNLKVMNHFTGRDYGPLNFNNESCTGKKIETLSYIDSRNFQGGSYVLATPEKGTTLKLYRLYGGNANAHGQYWMAEKRDGNMSTQIDLALHPIWKNTMQ